jgi:hypothetical protein
MCLNQLRKDDNLSNDDHLLPHEVLAAGCGAFFPPNVTVPPESPSFTDFRDNQQLRWLEGLDELEPGPVRPLLAAANLESARRHLETFDEVFILEEMDARENFRLAKYGWTDFDSKPSNDRLKGQYARYSGQAQPTDARKFFAEDPRTLSWLEEVQHWDIELYKYAQQIAARQASSSLST